jgi:hypothetical protein
MVMQPKSIRGVIALVRVIIYALARIKLDLWIETTTPLVEISSIQPYSESFANAGKKCYMLT